ncbi:hypothetical protein D3C72_1040250 [compost metagenome]
MADPRLSAGAGTGAGLPEDHPCGRRGAAGRDGVADAAYRRRIHAAARRGRPALYAFCIARPFRRQGSAAAATDRPPDQDRARGGDRVRQGRPRRYRDRSGSPRDVRDHHPVQAARPVACRHDDRQAGGGARPRGESTGPLQHLGAAHSQPDRHARHRHQEPGRHQGGGRGPEGNRPPGCAHRGGRQDGARCHVGAGRAPDRRALRRCRNRPHGGRPVRAQYRGCAERGFVSHRRRQCGRGGRRSGALSHQRPLSARLPRLGGATAQPAHCHGQGPADRPVRRGAHPGGAGTADAAQRKRAPVRLGVCRYPRARPALGRPGYAGRRRESGPAAGWLLAELVGAVRIPGAGRRKAEGGSAVHAADHLRAAVPGVRPSR